MSIPTTRTMAEPAPRDRPVAVLADVWKTYGEVVALAGLDLEIQPGEILGLLGLNGAGKTTTVDLLLGLTRPDAVRRVHQGLRVISPELAAQSWSDPDPLTDRERQVLRLAAEGLSTARIAKELHLSEGTVRNHLSEVIGKLGVDNRIEAARLARGRVGCRSATERGLLGQDLIRESSLPTPWCRPTRSRRERSTQ